MTPESVIETYLTFADQTLEALKGPSRAAPLVRHRQALMWELRAFTDLSLPEIGRIFNRHHTTVMWAIEQETKRRNHQ